MRTLLSIHAFSAKLSVAKSTISAFTSWAITWAGIVLASSAQGYFFAVYNGQNQAWWPTFGYTAAIFSIWFLLTPLLLKVDERLAGSAVGRPTLLALWIAGLPVAMTLHLLLFVLLFWPVYGTNFSSPIDMMKPVLLANLDKSAFAYAAILFAITLRRRRRALIREGSVGEAPRECATSEVKSAEAGLWIKTPGGLQLVQFNEIDWVAAAGDYAEIHAGGRCLLTDHSLTSLVGQLPEQEFARIHRATIIRVDRIREVHRLGRGDSAVCLNTGDNLRVSRRYRQNLARYLPL